jgi:hypothetical protein
MILTESTRKPDAYESAHILEAQSKVKQVQKSDVMLSSLRLVTAAQSIDRPQVAPGHAAYYGERDAEEQVLDVDCPVNCGVSVTRNHYGCLVLNASSALFIDVDMQAAPPSRIGGDLFGRLNEQWQRTFDDIRIVLGQVGSVGFRIYQTAAGFRILATGREFQPGSAQSNAVMRSVGADSHFVNLCRTQNNFRARLTPKPWRCGMSYPPSLALSSDHGQPRFTEWLSRYDQVSRGHATCRFLHEIRPLRSHERITRIVNFHDRMTKAFEHQVLA